MGQLFFSSNQILHSYDGWNNLEYITTPAPELSLGTTTTGSNSSSKLTSNVGNDSSVSPTNTVVANQSEALDELTVDDIRKHRVELLHSMDEAINYLPNAAFKQPQIAMELKGNLTVKLQNETNDSIFVKVRQLKRAIQQLNELKSKTDSSFGGLAKDDLIINPQVQQKILPLIENFIIVLEKQK